MPSSGLSYTDGPSCLSLILERGPASCERKTSLGNHCWQTPIRIFLSEYCPSYKLSFSTDETTAFKWLAYRKNLGHKYLPLAACAPPTHSYALPKKIDKCPAPIKYFGTCRVKGTFDKHAQNRAAQRRHRSTDCSCPEEQPTTSANTFDQNNQACSSLEGRV